MLLPRGSLFYAPNSSSVVCKRIFSSFLLSLFVSLVFLSPNCSISTMSCKNFNFANDVFCKSLFYCIGTYQSRVRRSSLDYSDEDAAIASHVNIDVAVNKIRVEYGPKACIIEDPCKLHALRPGRMGAQPDWNDILR